MYLQIIKLSKGRAAAMVMVGPFRNQAARKEFSQKVADVIEDSKMPNPETIRFADYDKLPFDFGALTEEEFFQMMSLGLNPADV